MLSSCGHPSGYGSPTQANLADNVAAMTSQANSTQTKVATVFPAYTAPMLTASPVSTPFPPNVPVWLAYKYTCQLVAGGGNMTMNLAWTDRSDTEEGYKIYRDKQVIATLAPNSTSYIDVVFVATGKTVSYSIEAFTMDWQASGSTITYGCQ